MFYFGGDPILKILEFGVSQYVPFASQHVSSVSIQWLFIHHVPNRMSKF
jgi:hypothetical protein